MHWTEERAARAELGKAFRRAGARIYGWHDDHSDAMTDYYDPESWQGLATYKGYVIVAGATPRWSARDAADIQFQANEKGKTWHIEKDGTVIASGVGLSKCSRHTYSWQNGISRDYNQSSRMAQSGADQLVQKIFRIIDRHIAGQGRQSRRTRRTEANRAAEGRIIFNSPEYRVEHRGTWTWIFFSIKPPSEVRDMLKEAGFRWSSKTEGWYCDRLVSLEELIDEEPQGIYQYEQPIGPKPAPRAYPPMISRRSPHQEQIRRLKGSGW